MYIIRYIHKIKYEMHVHIALMPSLADFVRSLIGGKIVGNMILDIICTCVPQKRQKLPPTKIVHITHNNIAQYSCIIFYSYSIMLRLLWYCRSIVLHIPIIAWPNYCILQHKPVSARKSVLSQDCQLTLVCIHEV